ncbi:PREDICTED: active regulator of SIRT1 [Crocodylus porosus]|uniref:Active regulator of SIRT1 n=1 Tax=Crocodylus porosus TaxID=8502 RepID=A0A7M4FN17_CROPO|nr:PREDICTED: active regulator of SIRT1 [Crocodylus porosus]
MSAALLRKGLELLEETAAAGRGAAPPGRRAGLSGRPKRSGKALRRKEMVQGLDGGNATVKGRVTKSAIDEYQKNKAVNHLKKNLQYMTNTRFVANKTITQQVLTHNQGRKSKDRPPEKPKKKSESTVFTEEDFQKFEKEYFGKA